MRILLTGATGFLGSRTLEHLVGFDYIDSIIATGRKLDSSKKVNHKKIKYALGDLTNSSFVNEISQNIDVIINTASLSSPWGSIKEFTRANILTQEHLIDSAIKYKIDRFIYISSPSIYYNGNDRFNVKEDTELPKKFVNNYSKTKRAAEILLEKSKLNYIVLRPRAIIGKGDTVIMPRLIKANSLGKLKIIGDGNNKVDLTSVLNVAHAIELSIKAKQEACNQCYNITNGEPIYLWKYINKVFEGLGIKKIENKIGAKSANLAAVVFELVSKYLTGNEPVLTRYSVGVLSQNFSLDISKAKNLLKYKPIINTDKSLDEFVKWYKNE